jgi:hypothetical protein
VHSLKPLPRFWQLPLQHSLPASHLALAGLQHRLVALHWPVQQAAHACPAVHPPGQDPPLWLQGAHRALLPQYAEQQAGHRELGAQINGQESSVITQQIGSPSTLPVQVLSPQQRSLPGSHGE